MRLPALLILMLCPLLACGPAGQGQAGDRPRPGYLAGTLTRDEPQPVYAPDPTDAANRIFYHLFTRSLQVRVAEEVADAGPFTPLLPSGFGALSISTRPRERIEGGDRAIDPLYPCADFQAPNGVISVLTEPRFTQLERALADALAEKKQRPPLARALLQGDAWAAFDVLDRYGSRREGQEKARCERLQGLLARLVKRLALTAQERAALPDNYAAAARAGTLPDLFTPGSGWLEVEWLRERLHDGAADCRRAARVFLKPAEPPADRQEFVNRLREQIPDKSAQLEAVALIIQRLLVDGDGKVTAGPLTEEVQVRTFVRGEGKLKETKLVIAELSRQALLADPRSSGLVKRADSDPGYLPFAGNDYGFASRLHLTREKAGESSACQPVLVTQRRRCAACHGEQAAVVMTFQAHVRESPPPVQVLRPADNLHGDYVAQEKMKRADFKALLRQWDK
jgi:hypothetical protein